jgi:serine/threonine protein kinase
LDKFDNLKLIDFGLSNQFQDESPLLKTVCGSPVYATPEMIKGHYYTKSTDIWSAGILLSIIVSGEHPFQDDKIEILLPKICNTEIQYPTFLSSQFVDLLKKMLQKNPVKRITIDQIKDHYWFSRREYLGLISEQMRETTSDDIEREIIDEMNRLGIDTKYLCNQVLCNEMNETKTIYRMLKQSKLRQAVNIVINEWKFDNQGKLMRFNSNIDQSFFEKKPNTRIINLPSPENENQIISPRIIKISDPHNRRPQRTTMPPLKKPAGYPTFLISFQT